MEHFFCIIITRCAKQPPRNEVFLQLQFFPLQRQSPIMMLHRSYLWAPYLTIAETQYFLLTILAVYGRVHSPVGTHAANMILHKTQSHNNCGDPTKLTCIRLQNCSICRYHRTRYDETGQVLSANDPSDGWAWRKLLGCSYCSQRSCRYGGMVATYSLPRASPEK